jgi:hypothetical protein
MSETSVIKHASNISIGATGNIATHVEIKVSIGLLISEVSVIPNFPAKPDRRLPRTFPVYAYDRGNDVHYYIETHADGSYEFSHKPEIVIAEVARLLKAAQ